MTYDVLLVCVVLAVALIGMACLLVWDGSDPLDWLGGRRENDDRSVVDPPAVVSADRLSPRPLADNTRWFDDGHVPSLREDVGGVQAGGGDRAATKSRGPARLTGSRPSDAQ